MNQPEHRDLAMATALMFIDGNDGSMSASTLHTALYETDSNYNAAAVIGQLEEEGFIEITDGDLNGAKWVDHTVRFK